MRRRTRPVITVQPMGNCAPWQPAERAMIRLRGKWVAQIFAPYTQLRVTREERNGSIVLVLECIPFDEPVTLTKGDESLKQESSDLTNQPNQTPGTPGINQSDGVRPNVQETQSEYQTQNRKRAHR